MRIISDFHDYYDTSSIYGVDRSIVYLRNTDKEPKPLSFKIPSNSNGLSEYALIGFCGELYFLLHSNHKQDQKVYGMNYLSSCSVFGEDKHKPYSIVEYGDEVLKREIYCVSREQDVFLYDIRDYQERHSFYRNETLNNYRSFMNSVQNEGIFLKYNTPIFLITRIGRNTSLILNPCLSEYRFGAIYDATSAFQKIQNFISNDLVKDRMVSIPVKDEIKISSHGFNNLSFRRQEHPRKSRKGK